MISHDMLVQHYEETAWALLAMCFTSIPYTWQRDRRQRLPDYPGFLEPY